MHFHIFCNQKSINKCHLSAIKEFEKRLSAYCETNLNVTPIPSVPDIVNLDNCHVLIIDKGMSELSSEQFSQKIKDLQFSGKSHVIIYICYKEALLYERLPVIFSNNPCAKMAITSIELSPETITLLFLEQLYRGYTILQGKTYHK